MTNTALSTQAAAKAPAQSIKRAPLAAGMGSALIAAMTPTTIEDAFRLAQALSQSGDMIPKHFQAKPQAIMAAMLQGAAVGMPPMQALQYIAVINGRPCVWGDALPAMVMGAGHFIDFEMVGEGKTRAAVATLTRKDGRKVVRQFSMADAERAGLAKKPGPWQQFPERMMAMRARAFAIRDGAPDVLLGLAIAEEVQDYGPDVARDVTPKQAAPRAGRARYLDPDPATLPSAQVDEIVEMQIEDAPEAEAVGDMFALTPEQQAELEAAQAEFERNT